MRRKGFTLLELVVVMTISLFLSASLGAGIITLQNITKLDTTIRSIKLEIQSAQNQARNSFITYNRSTSTGSQAALFGAGDAFLNIGWAISFENKGGGNLSVKRQAVYFKPDRNYDINSLRADIIKIREDLKLSVSQPFGCNNGVFVKGGSQFVFRSTFSKDPTNYTLRCAQGSGFDNYDSFEKIFESVELSDSANDLGTSSLDSCWKNAGTKSIFFTAGYGEPVLALSGSGAIKDCQIVAKIRSFGGGTKGLRVYKDTGTVEVCGNYCPLS
jgi:prepilin-type N-terminal cleavage/methylation domain-containing protein